MNKRNPHETNPNLTAVNTKKDADVTTTVHGQKGITINQAIVIAGLGLVLGAVANEIFRDTNSPEQVQNNEIARKTLEPAQKEDPTVPTPQSEAAENKTDAPTKQATPTTKTPKAKVVKPLNVGSIQHFTLPTVEELTKNAQSTTKEMVALNQEEKPEEIRELPRQERPPVPMPKNTTPKRNPPNVKGNIIKKTPFTN